MHEALHDHLECFLLGLILAQDAFLLLDHLPSRAHERMLRRWWALADARWVCPS